jgi:hypothetical protein
MNCTYDPKTGTTSCRANMTPLRDMIELVERAVELDCKTHPYLIWQYLGIRNITPKMKRAWTP